MIVDSEPPPLGTLRFHLARANPMAEIDGTTVQFSFLAVDAYVSPDWYETKGFVPTWNYIAVEARGRARAADEDALWRLLIDLSAASSDASKRSRRQARSAANTPRIMT